MAPGSSSSCRANALASAAMASARISRQMPRASPQQAVAALSMARGGSAGRARPSEADVAAIYDIPKGKLRKGKAKQIDWRESESGAYADEEEYSDGLNSRQRRLSRAARYGSAQAPGGPIALHPAWNAAVENFIAQSDKAALHRDHQRQAVGSSNNKATPQRAAILHLATVSPSRYAAIYTVLRQVLIRLGRDTELEPSDENTPFWAPEHVIEYSCGAGEGLWASAALFGESLKSYRGYDARGSLLRSAAEVVASAKIASSSQLSSTDSAEREMLHSVLNTDASFGSMRDAEQAKPRERTQRTRSFDGTSGSTLVISSFGLSNLGSDRSRSDFVAGLWERHPDAEVIALIEDADERGFSCIASAREELLGIGQRSANATGKPDMQLGGTRLYDTNRSKDSSDKGDGSETECHVVAPCPHDRPCPLLHDYQFLEEVQATNKTSKASSSLFHGAALGMHVCAHPQRLALPSYVRRTRHDKRAEETARHSYVIARRGPRPSLAREARELESGPQSFERYALEDQLRTEAARTKEGLIEEMRRGSRKEDVAIAEELPLDEGSEATFGADLGNNMDDEARNELLRILPEILKQQSGKNGASNQDEQSAALAMAQDVLSRSAEMGEAEAGAGNEDSSDADADEMLQLSSSFLAQQRGEAERLDAEPFDDSDPLEAAASVHAMRLESFDWPRLILPPLKRSGHVTFDACTATGAIERFTLSKSMGKQMYQDARKATLGDLLPYVPRVRLNRPDLSSSVTLSELGEQDELGDTDEDSEDYAETAPSLGAETVDAAAGFESPVMSSEEVDLDEADTADFDHPDIVDLDEPLEQNDLLEAEQQGWTDEIISVKALVTRISAAHETERNVQPPSAKLSRRALSAKPTGHSLSWPASSAEAIGPDRVAERAGGLGIAAGAGVRTSDAGAGVRPDRERRRDRGAAGDKDRPITSQELLQQRRRERRSRVTRKQQLSDYADDMESAYV